MLENKYLEYSNILFQKIFFIALFSWIGFKLDCFLNFNIFFFSLFFFSLVFITFLIKKKLKIRH